MIKNVEELKERHLSFIADFLENCTVEEKIDAYYVSIEIVSKHHIAFMKANGRVIDRADTILNEMWQTLQNDWTYFRMANEEWFHNHIGYKLYMFFMPVNKPLMTEYDSSVRYVIDRIESANYEIVLSGDEISKEIEGMQFTDRFGIRVKKNMKRYNFSADSIENIMNEFKASKKAGTEFSFTAILQSIINYNNSEVFAAIEPEGYIFKHGKKNIYQIINNPEIVREVEQERSQYEYLLIDFNKFIKNIDIIRFMQSNDYCKIVCDLFNEYIINYEKVEHTIENNINVDSIEPPCVGHRFGMYYNNIPNDLTISLCKENKMYENIFKILLVNLKKCKKEEHCILMNKMVIKEWNELVKMIENACVIKA